jgi:hypothetical protein
MRQKKGKKRERPEELKHHFSEEDAASTEKRPNRSNRRNAT